MKQIQEGKEYNRQYEDKGKENEIKVIFLNDTIYIRQYVEKVYRRTIKLKHYDMVGYIVMLLDNTVEDKEGIKINSTIYNIEMLTLNDVEVLAKLLIRFREGVLERKESYLVVLRGSISKIVSYR